MGVATRINIFTLSYSAMLFKLDPIKRFACFLLIFAGIALGSNFSNQVLLHLAVTLGFGLLLYAFYIRFSSKHKNVWDTVITCLILFLVLHYGEAKIELLYSLLTTFIAITLKFFLEFRGSPMVNPAAGSILLTAGILKLFSVEATMYFPGTHLPFASWWGTSYEGWISLALIALWIVGGFYVWKKFPILVTFLLAHAIFFYWQSGTWESENLDSLRFVFTDSTIYFFASIMLPEPKTSPFLPKQQVLYALLAAALYNGFNELSVPYFELFALVGANLTYMGTRHLR